MLHFAEVFCDVAQDFVGKDAEFFGKCGDGKYFVDGGLLVVVKAVFKETLRRSPVLVILYIKSTSEFGECHSLINSRVLVGILLTPLFCVKDKLLD